MIRVTAARESARVRESFGYDNNGNQTSRRTRSGAQFTLVYDAMNRLLRETGPNRRETFGYDASSLRTCAEVWPAASGTTTCGSGSPTHRITAAFDLALRLSSESARRAGTTRTVSYQYDANGNRTRVTWPDGWYAAYGFDAFNQLTTVDDNAGVALWRQSWRRDARLGQILRTGTAWGSGGNPAEGLTDLSYEADGDLSLLSHRFLAQGAGTLFNFTYGYNLASQLVSEAANQPNWQWAGATADTVPYAAANALDQYPSVDGLALTHDTNGNRTGYAGLTTTHDAENRLTAASKTGMSVSYLYDADGRRVWKDFSSGGSDTDFLSAGQMEIAEYDSTGKLLRRYVPGIALNERLAMINCGAGAGTCPTPATFSYTTNRQGSIIALVDSTGAISDRYLYTPYGVEEPLATSANPFRYTGQRFDPETGLYYYHARYYDPQQGRFLETDPVGYKDDLNSYQYAYHDPTDIVDPSGREVGVAYRAIYLADGGLRSPPPRSPRDWLGPAIGVGLSLAVAAPAAGFAAPTALANALPLTQGAIVASEFAVGDALGTATLAAAGSTTLYRVINERELADILKFVAFRASPEGSYFKEFVGSLADAQELLETFVKKFGGPQYIATGEASQAAMETARRTKFSDVGRSMDAIHIPNEQLDKVKVVCIGSRIVRSTPCPN